QVLLQSAAAQVGQGAIRVAVAAQVERGQCPAASGTGDFESLELLAIALRTETVDEQDRSRTNRLGEVQAAAQRQTTANRDAGTLELSRHHAILPEFHCEAAEKGDAAISREQLLQVFQRCGGLD